MTRAQILVVEDEALVARGIQEKLQTLGYDVPAVVDSGADAVQLAGKLQPDLVLMDIRLMGEMDGIEAAGEIRDRFDIPVIYLTAYSDDETLQRAKITEPFGYIVKPFRAGELHSLVEMGLYRHSIEQRLRESEARYRSVVEDQTEFIVRWLPDGAQTFVNRSYCSYFGMSQDEALGTSFFSAFAEADRETLRRRIEAVTPENPLWTDERLVILSEGRKPWTQWTHRGLFDPRGCLLEFQSVGRDITDRVRAEEALLEAKRAAEQARDQEERRRQEAERRRQTAEVLADVLAALNSNQSLDEVLDLIVTHTRSLLDTRAVAVLRFDAESERCALQAAQGLPGDLLSETITLLGNEALKQAMVWHQPVAIPDVEAFLAREGDQTQYAEGETLLAAWAERYPTLLAVPIMVQGKVDGVMLLWYTNRRAFAEEDVELAALFGAQVALAIENARLRREAEQAAVAAERNRLAHELHDAVTQSLFSASLIAEVLPAVWERAPDEGRRGLQELRRLTQGALAEMRTLLLELRPAGLTEQTLGVLIRRLADATAARSRMHVTAKVSGECVLSNDVHIALYRITQEALNNISKHARASRANVSLSCLPEQVRLHISDDGRGLESGTIAPHQLGMEIMRERAKAIGASFRIESRPGQGTEITVVWPAASEMDAEKEERP